MKKVKAVGKFSGQLRGDDAKEQWFSALRKEVKISLPKIGATSEVKLKPSLLNGAMLSSLDGSGSLTVDGKKVSKMKVYNGEVKLPATYSLTFIMQRNSDASCRLKAAIASK